MTDDGFKPRVLIIGAGLGGLTLAAILQRANIPYDIFEKAGALKPLGSAISLGPGVMPMLTQLGIADEVVKKAKIAKESFMYNRKLQMILHLDYHTDLAERFGWPNYIVSRPAIQSTLLSLIPPERIHFNKRVLSQYEIGDGIMIRTSDNKTHHGHILVGADGAYSGVRQSLYEYLNKRDLLAPADKLPLKYGSVCLVGQTRPLSEDIYAHISDDACRYEAVLDGSKPVIVTSERTVCWMVVEVLNEETNDKHDNFRASEWGPEAAETMAKEVRDFRIRDGLTIGDLIDRTPREVMCKVMLEEKLFETWTYGRTVLMGDACHKMAPNGGLGGQSAMFDAVVLANHINTIRENKLGDIEQALTAYREERFPLAKDAVAVSSSLISLVKQNMMGILMRQFMKHVPRSVWYRMRAKIAGYRPQISFLPLVEDKGTDPPRPQLSLETTRRREQVSVSA
ncbi:hypothetical protein BGZ98_009772 [Dissophora globulifera]|nr:hypothetical protein BGZ98_009772 [Dissophora globulifera]